MGSEHFCLLAVDMLAFLHHVAHQCLDQLPAYSIVRISGMGKGTGSASAPRKPKTPLAEQRIDPHTMPMKTIIKCAMAKDRVKAIAEQAARVRHSHK